MLSIRSTPWAARALRWPRPCCNATPRTTLTFSKLPRSYSYSTAANEPPPLIQSLKGELKTAMRAKDTPRLNVLRAIMAANLNASKTDAPLRTDQQVVALIRKLCKGAEDAVAEAREAGRQDLVDRETQQLDILNGYVASSGVETMGETELEALAKEVVEAVKATGSSGKGAMGEVMKRMVEAVKGKDVDKKSMSQMVNKMLGQ